MSVIHESKPDSAGAQDAGQADGGAFDMALNELLTLTSDAFITLDERGDILTINRAAESIFGYTVEDVRHTPVSRLLAERSRKAYIKRLLTLHDPGEPARFLEQDFHGLHKDGREFPVEVSAARMPRSRSIILVMRDRTDRITAERRSQQLDRIIEASINEVYLINIATRRFLRVNRRAQLNLGYDRETVQQLTISDIAPLLLDAEFEAAVTPLLQGHAQETTLHTFHQRRDGSTYEVDVNLHLMPWEQPPVLVANAHDVTEHTTYETLIQRQSHYDPLTLLPNRTLLIERLRGTVADMQRLGETGALLLVNISDLQLISDTLGRDATDRLLQEITARLEKCLGDENTLARVGEQKFAIIAPHLNPPDIIATQATRILEALAAPFTLGAYRTMTTAHVGITLFPRDGNDAKTLLRNSSAAVGDAIRSGSPGYKFFTPQLNATAKTQFTLKSCLTGALERDEFQLVFQPQMDIAAGRISGAEALLRWTSPDLGEQSPTNFVPVLEDTGMITPVGDWVLEQACRQSRILKDAGFSDLRLAVNLSVRQIRPALLGTVAEKLNRYGLTHDDLEFEITESVLMREGGQAVDVLNQMATTGFRLAMDDFGCGYSSLSHLRQLPLGTIKIDRSFINELTSDPTDAEIVRAIIAMGKALNRRLVAEGVETNAQLNTLRDLGCDEIQGYLISQPLSSAALMRFLSVPFVAPL